MVFVVLQRLKLKTWLGCYVWIEVSISSIQEVLASMEILFRWTATHHPVEVARRAELWRQKGRSVVRMHREDGRGACGWSRWPMNDEMLCPGG
jgi:hypothetical protein